ncbi:MAG: flagellar protein FlgN [Kangiellaceae bacterium]|nr:flagellar protein FlgN [Kangiellaceae bacterium]
MKETQIYQTLINQWMSQYNELLELLSQEQRTLEKRDFEQLEMLVRQKNELVNKISLEQIPSIINDGNVAQLTFSQVKQYCLQTPDLQDEWKNLMTLVGQCHHKNEVNSKVIELMTKSTKRTFNLIKGFDPDNNIYDAKGDRKIVSHYGRPVSA